ncbi:MAG: ATP-binding protein [Polyangiaceae bacterium]|jgi:signal transduction histidine kinase
MRLTTRFGLLVGALLVAVGAATWSGWRALGTVDLALKSVVDREMQRLLTTTYVRRAFRMMELDELDFVWADESSARTALQAQIDAESRVLEGVLDRLAALMAPEDAPTIASIRQQRAEWLESHARIVRLVAEDPLQARVVGRARAGWPTAWEGQTLQLIAVNEKRLGEQASRAHGIAARARGALVLVSAVATLGAIGFGALILLGIRRNIRSVAEVNANLERLVEARTATLAERERSLQAALVELTEESRARQQAEVELRHAQKLEAVGRLAAGIAHNINTPLQFVRDSVVFVRDAVDQMARSVEPYRRLREAAATAFPDLAAEALAAANEEDTNYLLERVPVSIDRALDGLARMAMLVEAMKDFARQDSEDKALADLNQALRTVLTVARSQYESVAEVETDFGELPLVSCHIGALHHVFLNMVANAAQAIGEKLYGTDARGVIKVASRQEGASVVVTVSDNGTGIPDAIRDKVFEPFFTTKDEGHGTGQGLAVGRSVIVEKHGGTLTFDTHVGEGTTFFIRLPVAARPVPAPRGGPDSVGRRA